LRDLASFPLLDAIYGRRSRRFSLGAEIPDGVFTYASKHDPLPLTDLERMLVLTSVAGTTGWHYGITRHARYAPHLSNYSAAATGRTFPSAAGFHTSEVSSPTTLAPTFSRPGTRAPSSTRLRRRYRRS
jgi:hypothetical protein